MTKANNDGNGSGLYVSNKRLIAMGSALIVILLSVIAWLLVTGRAEALERVEDNKIMIEALHKQDGVQDSVLGSFGKDLEHIRESVDDIKEELLK